MKRGSFTLAVLFSIYYTNAQNVFPATGNVGIGTSSPAALLHVNDPVGSTPLIRLSNNSYFTEFIQNSYNTTINASVNFLLNWGNNALVFQGNAGGTAGKFYLTANYGAFLNGWGGLRVGYNEKFGFYTHGSTGIYSGIGANRIDENNWGLSFFSKNAGTESEVVRIHHNGNTLIGTLTDNGNKLQVNGNVWSTGLVIPTNAAAGKVLTSDANGNATWQTATSGSAGWGFDGNAPAGTTNKLGTTNDKAVTLITNNTDRVYISNTGNVGINTVTPTEKLSVNGNVLAEIVKVIADVWPDYVFDNDYQLPSLQEVEKFIQQHKHLPEVPSAEDVKNNGQDLGEIQAVLLKKIEELTLYVIAQQKEIDALKQEMKKSRKVKGSHK